MNIAFFSKQLPSDEPNGVSVQVHRLAEALTAGKHTVTVFTLSPPVEGALYRCVTLPSRSTSGWYGKFLPALLFRGVDKTGFDIIHFHGDDYLCRGSSRRVRTFYGSALNEALHAGTVGRRCYQAFFHLLEWVSCLKKGTLAAISETTQRSLPLVKVHIPCCVPLDRYCPSNRKTGYPSLLFLGDFNSRKRGGLLLDAFSSEILPAFPDTVLTVVGPVPCSGNGIRYAGRCSEEELIALYRESWALCLPSSYEGFGVPVIEAMACGTAVVATSNPGSNQLVHHERDGILCSPTMLGASVNRLLGDERLRMKLASEGIRTASAYDTRIVAQHYENLYRRAGEAWR
ncbi:MAG: glycosyltransferase family 4 protein [Chitinispirillaceae bacterium]|nr:glycosyltransferase family 4 protein [Chitinispirillaceae bacterium]